MKFLIIFAALALSACSPHSPEVAHIQELEAKLAQEIDEVEPTFPRMNEAAFDLFDRMDQTSKGHQALVTFSERMEHNLEAVRTYKKGYRLGLQIESYDDPEFTKTMKEAAQ